MLMHGDALRPEKLHAHRNGPCRMPRHLRSCWVGTNRSSLDSGQCTAATTAGFFTEASAGADRTGSLPGGYGDKRREPAWGGRVDGLLVQTQVTIERLQFVQEADQMLQTPSQPIH